MGFKKKLAFGITLIGGTTLALHIINKIIHLSALSDNNSCNDIEELTYKWKLGDIYYTKRGEGSPVLLIHDLSTYSSSIEWCKITEELSKTNTVYTLDLLGCGKSDKPHLTYTNYLYVQLITDFIKEIIKNKTDIVATGESGSFVLAACQNNSDIIDKVIMVNPYDMKFLASTPNEKSKLLTKLINLPIFGTFFYNMCTKKEDVYNLFEDEYFYDNTKIDTDLILSYYENTHLSNPESKYLFASIAGCYTTFNIKNCIKNIDNDVFIIIGEKDEEYKKIAEEYEEFMPTIKTITIEDTKYLPQLETPEEFTEELLTLLFSI